LKIIEVNITADTIYNYLYAPVSVPSTPMETIIVNGICNMTTYNGNPAHLSEILYHDSDNVHLLPYNIYLQDKLGGSGLNKTIEYWFYHRQDGSIINENDLTLYNIFPNPAHVIIYFHLLGMPYSLIVRNILGQSVMQEIPNNYSVNISALKSGMYFLEMH